jgi:CheY-like chemotaxis protein
MTTSSKARVLLVEDYAPNVLVASTFLEGFGYEVDVADNGIKAVEMITANRYIAALMDVQMDGMDGLEATQAVRTYEQQANKARTFIIGMTAHALMGDRERCLAAGMDEYIAKPFNPDQLEAMLGELAQQHSAAA